MASPPFAGNATTRALLIGVRHLVVDPAMVQQTGDQNVIIPLSSVNAAASQHSRVGGFSSKIAQDLRTVNRVNVQSLEVSTASLVQGGTYQTDFGSYGYGAEGAEGSGLVVAIVVPDAFFEALERTTKVPAAGPMEFHIAFVDMITSATLSALNNEQSLTKGLE